MGLARQTTSQHISHTNVHQSVSNVKTTVLLDHRYAILHIEYLWVDEGICNTLACGLHYVGAAQCKDHQYSHSLAQYFSYQPSIHCCFHENVITANIVDALHVSQVTALRRVLKYSIGT